MLADVVRVVVDACVVISISKRSDSIVVINDSRALMYASSTLSVLAALVSKSPITKSSIVTAAAPTWCALHRTISIYKSSYCCAETLSEFGIVFERVPATSNAALSVCPYPNVGAAETDVPSTASSLSCRLLNRVAKIVVGMQSL